MKVRGKRRRDMKRNGERGEGREEGGEREFPFYQQGKCRNIIPLLCTYLTGLFIKYTSIYVYFGKSRYHTMLKQKSYLPTVFTQLVRRYYNEAINL
jgi:hypothetical protein